MKSAIRALALLASLAGPVRGNDVVAQFTSLSTIPVASAGYSATGNSVLVSLDFAPPVGADLTVVDNTGPDPISGRFSNLQHGQRIGLKYQNANYQFVANYYGGTGNDLVLQWAGRSLHTWGSNSYGQLGNDCAGFSSVPLLILRSGSLAGKSLVSVKAGLLHNIALCSDGSLATWGNNSSGQLGSGSTTYSTRTPEVVDATDVLAGKTVIQISAGERHNLALCSDGTVASWGYNFSGQLGEGTTSNRTTPVAVIRSGILSGKTVVSVAAGSTHSLALCSDGTVAAWGSNSSGELGNGGTTNSSVPVALTDFGVLTGKTVVAVSAGGNFSVALCSDGTVATWGSNLDSQLGDGSTVTKSKVPVAVSTSGVLAGKFVTAISAGQSHVLALCSDGSLVSWGYNNHGQLGNGGVTKSNVPVAVVQSGVLATKTVSGISTGQHHSFVRCSDGSVAAWGLNADGQLGNGHTTDSSIPTAVGIPAGKQVIEVSAGDYQSYAVFSDGTAAMWGDSFGGLLEHPKIISSSDVPTSADPSGVLGDKTVMKVSAGYAHCLALCADGAMASWGLNASGQLGDGSNDKRGIPAAVTATGALANKEVIAVAAGGYHSLCLCSDGTVFAWGANAAGQLGNNSTIPSNVPVEVTPNGLLSGKTVIGIYAGTYFSLALCSDGTVAAWGANDSGQLGIGTTTSSSVPVAVSNSGVLSGKTVVSIATGNNHCLALCSDGTVASWGANGSGQLGNFSYSDSKVPTLVNTNGVLSGKSVTAIAGGFLHSLALCSDGTLAAWGSNTAGQLGNNSTTGSNVPVAVINTGALSGKTVIGLSAGSYFSHALCSDGTMTTWGDDRHSKVPVAINDLGTLAGMSAITMDAGSNHSVLVAAAPLSSDASLRSLSADSLTLAPLFTSNTTSYSASVPNSLDSVTITPETSDDYASVTVNGNPASSGSATPPIPLNPGLNTITIEVTAQNGSSVATYQLQISRSLPSVSSLSGLLTSKGTLNPSFASDITSYQINVPNKVASLAVTAQATDNAATVKINGKTIDSGTSSSSIPLVVGSNTLAILVTAQDGVTKTSYQIKVIRAKSSDATLSRLRIENAILNPTFQPDLLTYEATVVHSIKSVKLKATANHSAAAIKINGIAVNSGSLSREIPLKTGKNSIKILVTAQDGTTKPYKITITRKAAANSAPARKPLIEAERARSAEAARPATVSRVTVNGATYLQITLHRDNAFPRPNIEVSSDLVNWTSGRNHTTTVFDNGRLLIVRDNTPLRPGAKRYMRVNP